MVAKRYHHGPPPMCLHLGGQQEGLCGWQGPWRWCLTCSQCLYLDTMRALEDLLTSLLQRNMTPQGLQTMVEVSGGAHAAPHLVPFAFCRQALQGQFCALCSCGCGGSEQTGVHMGVGPDAGGGLACSRLPSVTCWGGETTGAPDTSFLAPWGTGMWWLCFQHCGR